MADGPTDHAQERGAPGTDGPLDVIGFVVHGFVQGGSAGSSRLAFLGRLEDGRTFAAVAEPFRPRFFVRADDLSGALHVAAGARVEPEARTADAEEGSLRSWSTMDGSPAVEVSFGSLQAARRADSDLRSRGVRTYEAELAGPDQVCIDAGLHGSIRIQGAARPGAAVDLVFVNPLWEPAEWEPRLEVLSLDIETDPRTDEILAVGLVSTGTWRPAVREVLFNGRTAAADSVRCFDGEAPLLAGLVERIREIDPDLITGWNVIDFDFAVISRRLDHHRIPFLIARSPEPARFLAPTRNDGGRRQSAGVSCHGRLVIDALRLVRYGPQRFDDRKLGSVAREVLGESKTVEAQTSAERIRTLLALYRDDPRAFCDYCLTDAALVLRILRKTGLLELTIRRSRLIGISLNRAWTSVAAFDFIYIEAMHARGLVAPSLGVDRLPQGDVPGGAILKPEPGLFTDVLVFDFKSLYPSIIRTFGIDPVGYLDSDEGYPEGAEPPPAAAEWITAPNGARFRRDGAILPSLLDRFWASREEAKRRGDGTASFVYKIVMNSFYGVLGSPGCRFAGAPLAGAITGFGQYLLHWTRDRFTSMGHRVIYGDTDSLFVLPFGVHARAKDSGATDHAARRLEPAELFALGQRLCDTINRELAAFIARYFDLPSRLELEFEQVYGRFYLPRIRHVAGETDPDEIRGRAKGYAGQPVAPDGTPGTLDIKGMEAIRSDWTRVAGRLQEELLSIVFSDGGPDADADRPARVWAHVERCIADVRSGGLDADLVYARRLRKPVSSYTRSRPPHVQAALLLPRDEQEGTIEYLMTVEGPQPAGRQTGAIDYDHYVSRQIRPIAEPICEVVGLEANDLFDPTGQLSLF